MQRLKSRDKQIPNGFWFRQPEINWHSKKVLGLHPSFTTLVSAVINARRANPHHVAKYKWSLDRDVVGNEVEAFQVKVCLAGGWTSYLTESGGGAPPPLSQPPSPAEQRLLAVAAGKARRLWAGVKTLNDFLDSGEPPVPSAQAESRAATCVACPLNGKGDFTTWFTVPAAAAIKRQLERVKEMNLATTQDDKLNVCTGCLCPLKLKVWTPWKFIKPHLETEVLDELRKGKNCWILAEMGK